MRSSGEGRSGPLQRFIYRRIVRWRVSGEYLGEPLIGVVMTIHPAAGPSPRSTLSSTRPKSLILPSPGTPRFPRIYSSQIRHFGSVGRDALFMPLHNPGSA